VSSGLFELVGALLGVVVYTLRVEWDDDKREGLLVAERHTTAEGVLSWSVIVPACRGPPGCA